MKRYLMKDLSTQTNLFPFVYLRANEISLRLSSGWHLVYKNDEKKKKNNKKKMIKAIWSHQMIIARANNVNDNGLMLRADDQTQ